MLDAIIFDFDGTLVRVQSDRPLVAVLKQNCALTSAEIKSLVRDAATDWDAVQKCIGSSEREKVYEQVIAANCRRMIRLRGYYRTRRIIGQLAQTYDLFVLSARDEPSLISGLETLGILSHFTGIRGAKSGGAPNKPDPDVLIQLLTAQSIRVSAAVYVGDREIDRAMADAAGVTFIGAFDWRRRSAQQWEATVAAAAIRCMR